MLSKNISTPIYFEFNPKKKSDDSAPGSRLLDMAIHLPFFSLYIPMA